MNMDLKNHNNLMNYVFFHYIQLVYLFFFLMLIMLGIY